MTDKNEAEDVTTQTPPATADAKADDQAQQPDAAIVPDDDDPDARELAALQAELEAEEKAAAGEPAKGEEGKASPDAAAAKPNADPEPPKDKTAATPMIPKERFDEALDKSNRYKSEAEYWKGLAEAAAANAAKNADPAKPAEPSREEQIAVLEAEREDLLKRADDYDLKPSEMLLKHSEIERKIAALQTPEPAKSQPAPTPREDLYLNEKTQALRTAHPYTSKIDALEDADDRWDILEREAAKAMAKAGTPLDANNPVSVLQFRERVAKLTDVYGPLWAGPLDQSPSSPTADPKNRDTPSTVATDRAAKLDMADKMPPSLDKMNASGGELQITEAQIEAMTDEEIDALPAATKARIVGGSF